MKSTQQLKLKSNQNVLTKASTAKSKKFVDIPTLIIVLFFLITTLLFFKDNIFGHSYFWEDFVEYVYPTQNFAALESSHGHIPFWNPYAFSGMPFYADLQAGFFYLPNRILTFPI